MLAKNTTRVLNDTVSHEEEFSRFVELFPDYKNTQHIDELRQTEYSRLDKKEQVYLDYTGSGLYADTQLLEHQNFLRDNVLGNPHSINPSSLVSTDAVEETRKTVLEFFNALNNEYDVVFTLNASGALKIIGESYPFTPNGKYLLTFDNHNSVNGIREYARSHNCRFFYVPLTLPDMYVDHDRLIDELERGSGDKLFALPAQSNYSGIRHSLAFVAEAKKRGWDVVLDAAAFVPTNRLNLSEVKPDFVPVSFYKMFGYPTGVGCLIARKEALAKLHRPWFAGGTITVASVQGDKFYFAEGPEAFEDGTLNFISIPAVKIGLDYISSIGIDNIHRRVTYLTSWLVEQLLSLHHVNGKALVRVYGSHSMEHRGGAVTMNFYDKYGRFIDHRFIEEEASKYNISLRTGCFCNPGGGETALGLSQSELTTCFNAPSTRLTIDDFRMCIDGKSTGAVRVSLGIASNFADVFKFIQFAKRFLD